MRTFPRRISRTQRRKAERGVALVLVMIFLGLMLLLGLAATITSITEVNVSTNLGLQMEAFDTADAGAVHAFELVRYMKGDFTELLRGFDNTLKTGDEFEQHVGATFSSAGVRAVLPGNQNMFDGAKVSPIPKQPGGVRSLVMLDPRHFYELIPYDDAGDPKSWISPSPLEKNADSQWATRYNQDFDQRVMIRSIGYVMSTDTTTTTFNPANNVIASAVVDVVVGLTPFPAIISNDDLDLTNSIAVSGAYGSVHANDDLLLGTGNFTVSQSATFTNTDGTTPSGGWNPTSDDSHVTGYNGPAGEVFIPDIKPYTYAPDCGLIFIHAGAQAQERAGLVAEMNAASAGSGTNLVTAVANDLSGLNFLNDTTTSITLERTGSAPGWTWHVVDYGTVNNDVETDPTTGYSITMKTSGGTPGANVTALGGGSVSTANPPPPPPANARGIFLLLPRGNADVEINSSLDGYISLFTNSDVHLNGNSNLAPAINIHPPEQPPWDFINMTVCTTQDIWMNGNAASGQALRGIFYAHEQFRMTGSGQIQGQIVGYSKTVQWDTSTSRMVTTSGFSSTTSSFPSYSGGDSKVDVGGSILSGNFEVLFNAGTGFLGTFAQVAWRQLHDFKPVADAR